MKKYTNSILNKYLKDVKRYPLLTRQEERDLIYQKCEGSKEAKDTLVNSNLRVVIKVANIYKNQCRGGIEFIDLVNEGNLGLIKAVERFDNTQKNRVTTYAVWWIRQKIKKYLVDNSGAMRLPNYKAEEVNRYYTLKNKYFERKGKPPSVDYMIKQGFEEKYIEVFESHSNIKSLDNPIHKGLEMLVRDAIVGDTEEQIENKIMNDELEEILRKKLNELSKRELELIIHNFGLFNKPKLTLLEQGENYSLSKERVKQLKNNVLKRYKKDQVLREILRDLSSSHSVRS